MEEKKYPQDQATCKHPNKIVLEYENLDGEIYYDCPDCGAGWRQEPETEADRERAWEILLIDLKALNEAEKND